MIHSCPKRIRCRRRDHANGSARFSLYRNPQCLIGKVPRGIAKLRAAHLALFPREGHRILVTGLEVSRNMLNQSIDTGEAGPFGGLASEDAEPDFDLIEPTGRSRGAVKFHVRMPGQVAQRIERRLYLSYPACGPLSQLLCRVRPPTMTTMGWPLRP